MGAYWQMYSQSGGPELGSLRFVVPVCNMNMSNSYLLCLKICLQGYRMKKHADLKIHRTTNLSGFVPYVNIAAVYNLQELRLRIKITWCKEYKILHIITRLR
jgi:hypothetical protein